MAPFDPPLDPDEVRAAFPGRYADLVPLKTGGQGCVFCGTIANRHEPRGAKVALKIYFADQVRERTEREINALTLIAADPLVRLVGTGHQTLRDVPCVWLETQFIEGESLASLIGAGPLSVPAISQIAIDIAAAIDALWVYRIVHRDIKPDNIMVTPQGRAVLIDLGIARHTALSPLTTYGKTWGTEGYLSPEQAEARRSLTCRSDVFALGIVVQEAILGRHPTKRNQDLLMGGGVETKPLRADLPPGFAGLVDEMVRRQAFLRPTPTAVAERFLPFTAAR
jgi:serine/threonine protein kinase